VIDHHWRKSITANDLVILWNRKIINWKPLQLLYCQLGPWHSKTRLHAVQELQRNFRIFLSGFPESLDQHSTQKKTAVVRLTLRQTQGWFVCTCLRYLDLASTWLIALCTGIHHQPSCIQPDPPIGLHDADLGHACTSVTQCASKFIGHISYFWSSRWLPAAQLQDGCQRGHPVKGCEIHWSRGNAVLGCQLIILRRCWRIYPIWNYFRQRQQMFPVLHRIIIYILVYIYIYIYIITRPGFSSRSTTDSDSMSKTKLKNMEAAQYGCGAQRPTPTQSTRLNLPLLLSWQWSY
jgi:hypothetical protein